MHGVELGTGPPRETQVHRVVAVLIMASASGCAMHRKVYDAAGIPAYRINCSGTALTWGVCQQRASRLCGAEGYTITDQTHETGVMSLPDGKGGINQVAMTTRIMTVRCGNGGSDASRHASPVEYNSSVAPIDRTNTPTQPPVRDNNLYVVSDDPSPTILGCLTCNEYDPNSIINGLGTYGSPMSPNSMANPMSIHGSRVSPSSACNPLAMRPPWIVDVGGTRYGRFTANTMHPERNDSAGVAALLQRICASQ